MARLAPCPPPLSRFVLIAAVLATCFSPATGRSDWRDELRRLSERHQGEVSVVVRHLPSGEQFQYRADAAMPTASLIKLPVMIETYRRVEEGSLDLDDFVELEEEDKVPGSGILTRHFSAGTRIRVRDAVRLMIAHSDNTATNLVLDQVGLEHVNDSMRRLDCPQTRIHAKVFRRDTSIDPEASRQYGLGVTTAAEIAGLLERLATQTLIAPEADREMLQHLEQCEDRSKLGRGLPDGVKFGHKTGSVAKVRCDAGVVSLPEGQLILCVLTAENEDRSWSDDNEAHVLCGNIARVAYRQFTRSDTEPGSGVLKEGVHSRLVEDLQRTLNVRLDSVELAVDGDYGPNTAAAVRAFQKSRGLDETGEVGPKTWEALGELVTDEPPVPTLEELQASLPQRAAPEPLDGPPHVTCKAWASVDADGSPVADHDGDKQLPMASTTKIMTAFLVLREAARDPAVLDQQVTFSARADETPGSTSGLRAGEQLPVRELLYGLLLPSGNDASVALAEHFGRHWAGQEGDSDGQPDVDPLERFVARMNEAAAELGMKNTRFKNPHGLSAEGHYSSARDLLKLAVAAWELPHFQDLVGSRVHVTTVQSDRGYERRVAWRNTNRLLHIENYRGVKTGTTRAAGACLVSYGERGETKRFVVVLGSASSDARYVDTRNLYRWLFRDSS